MKKILFTISVAAMLGLGMTSCNNQPQKNDTQKEAKGTIADSNADLKIAYVEVDTIMSKYQYWKDVMKLMQGKQANIQKTLQGKQQSLQQAAANFQQGIQSNKYSQAQAQQIQANLQQRLGSEYQKEVEKYNTALSDSIHHFLAEYNKDKKFSLILAKQGDNILYASNALDITDQVVAGLNKRYKGMGGKK